MKKQRILMAAAILAIIGLLPFSRATASSILKTTMDEMLQASEFVFEGRALSVASRQTGPKRIHTFVTCEINDIIKGAYPEPTVTLRFLGGTVGDLTMAVSHMQVPREGEHGIYFVESLGREQIHPLYGWNQGHFTVAADHAGTNRVMTRDNQPVTGLSFDTAERKTSVKVFSTGVATGVAFEQKRPEAEGLTPDEFKQALRKRLGEQTGGAD